MVEEVTTGGLKKFVYEKNYNPIASPEEKRDIEEAYRRAEERKVRERKSKMILWFVVALILVGSAVYFLSR